MITKSWLHLVVWKTSRSARPPSRESHLESRGTRPSVRRSIWFSRRERSCWGAIFKPAPFYSVLTLKSYANAKTAKMHLLKYRYLADEKRFTLAAIVKQKFREIEALSSTKSTVNAITLIWRKKCGISVKILSVISLFSRIFFPK